jgi:hypothetical protein
VRAVAIALCLLTCVTSAAVAHEPTALGPEFVVTSSTSYDQSHVWVCSDDSGNFVIAYSLADIYARRLDRNGKPLGPDFLVNHAIATGNQNESFVACDPATGDFLVCGSDWGGIDGMLMGTLGRFYAANGTPRGPDKFLNVTTANSQFEPHAAFSVEGRAMVVWTDAGLDGSAGCMGRMFDRNGAPLTGEFLINHASDQTQIDPTVAASRDGLFVVAFVDASGTTGEPREILARLFDRDGVAVGPQFKVNGVSAGMQRDPHVAMDADGDFVVVWQDEAGNDGSGFGVFARRFDAQGNALGPQFSVAAGTLGNQRDPHVAMDFVGNFVVTWESDVSGTFDVMMRRFDRNGVALSGDMVVHADTAGNQTTGRVAVGQSGERIVATWHDDRLDGQAMARVFEAPALTIAGNAALTQSITFDIELPGMAGKPYFLLPSFGTGPALEVNGARSLPLAADPLMTLAVTTPESQLFGNITGMLGPQGDANATFLIPNDPAWYGAQIRFAALTVDAGWIDQFDLQAGSLDGIGFLSEVRSVKVASPPRFFPGQRITGEIVASWDEDRGIFEALKGEKIVIAAMPVDGPDAGPAAPFLKLEVRDAAGALVKEWTGPVPASGKKGKLKLKMKKSGTYSLSVFGDALNNGAYELDTSNKVKKSAMACTKKVTAGSDNVAKCNLMAVSDTTLDIVVRPGKKSALPNAVFLVDPNGALTNLQSYLTIVPGPSGPTLVAADVPMGATGKFQVLLSAPPGSKYTVELTPLPPTAEATVVLE